MKLLRAILVVLGSVFIIAGCGSEGGTEPESETPALEPVGSLAGDTGKADGITFRIKDFFRHTRELVLSDLTDRVAELATDKVNDLLSELPFADIRISETELFGLEAGSSGGSTIHSLPSLQASLSQRFGAKDFVAGINELRVKHLEQSGDEVFGENTFRVDLSVDPSFSTDLAGFAASLGFGVRDRISARVVQAYPNNFKALLREPLKSAKEMRHFVLPRDARDVVSMNPGESVTLSGEGTLGLNVAANLPILAFDPIEYLVITTRFSLGARAMLQGVLDVQLIRGEGNTAYVEIGMTNTKVRSIRAGVSTGFGLVEIPSLLEVSVLGKEYTLGEIAEKVISNYLTKSKLLSYGVEGIASGSNSRMTLSRFSFDLSDTDGDAAKALTQAVAGDVRLAQALADRQGSGVVEMVSFERTKNTSRRYLGAHVASMAFFRELRTNEGRIYIQDGDYAEEILFEELRKASGAFFAKWGYTRLLLFAQHWLQGVFVDATSNLRLAVTEADKLTSRDQVLDHVDALLLTAMPFNDLYHILTGSFEELSDRVDESCKECQNDDDWHCEQEYEKCVDKLIKPDEVEAWRKRLEAMITDSLEAIRSSGDDASTAERIEIADKLLHLKLLLSSIRETNAAIKDTAGRTAILLDVRITQGGLNQLFTEVGPEQFTERLVEMFVLLVSRRKAGEDKYEDAVEEVDDERKKIRALTEIYSEIRDSYLRLDSVSSVRVGGEAIGDRAYVIVPASQEEGDLTLRSLAEQKGALSAELFDRLVERANDLSFGQVLAEIFTFGLADPRGFDGHHLVAYTIASLVERPHRELLVNLDFEKDVFEDNGIFQGATDGGLIDAGEFDLDLLLGN